MRSIAFIAYSNNIHIVNAQPEGGGRTKPVVRGTQTLTTNPTLKARLLQPVCRRVRLDLISGSPSFPAQISGEGEKVVGENEQRAI